MCRKKDLPAAAFFRIMKKTNVIRELAMKINYTPELLEYMDKKKNHTILVELVEINNTDLEVIDLHVYLPHKNQREKFITEKKYRVITTEVGEVLLPPYPLKIDEEITFGLKKLWIFRSISYTGIKI